MSARSAALGLPLLALSGAAHAQARLDAAALAEMQTRFVAAYNRGDTDVMADAFTANAIRVAPSGILQGRDAIRQSFENAVKLGLHDYSLTRTVTRSEGPYPGPA